MTTFRQIINERDEYINGKWSVQDEAIHRGTNYATAKYDIVKELLNEGASLSGILKQAYQEGFLHGFGHKFDQTNYEEK
jgi:hypothetical protein